MAKRRRRGRRPWFAPIVVALLVGVWALLGERLRGPLGLPGDGAASPKSGDQLRVATWNLKNFPGEHQDRERLKTRLHELGADVIAVQEIHDPGALRRLMPGWELHLSETGGRGGQRLGVMFDPAAVELVGAPREHRELAMGGGVRPGFSVYLRVRGGPDFHLVVVHLKAMDEGYELRRAQWPVLAQIVETLRGAGPGRDDDDVIVLGDFNATGPAGGTPADELAALDARLGGVGLQRLANHEGCSAYWDGPRRDAWQEPSQLDLIWAAGLKESLQPGSEVRPLHHCARHHCAAFRSTAAHPERDYADLSDHCPVVLDLQRSGDDDP